MSHILTIGGFDCNDRTNSFLVSWNIPGVSVSWETAVGDDLPRQGPARIDDFMVCTFRVRLVAATPDALETLISALRAEIPGLGDLAETTATFGLPDRSYIGTLTVRRSQRAQTAVDVLYRKGDRAEVDLTLTCDPYLTSATETLYDAAAVTLPAVVSMSAQTGDAPAPWDLLFDFDTLECVALFAGRYPDASATIADFAVEAVDLSWTGGAATTDAAGYPDGSGNTVWGNQSATEVVANVDVTDFEPGEYLVVAKCKATTANTGTIRHTYCAATDIPTTTLGLLPLGVVTLPCAAVRGSATSNLAFYLAGDATNYGYLNAVFFIPVSFGGMVGWRRLPGYGHAHEIRWEDELVYADDVGVLGEAFGGRHIVGKGGALVMLAEQATPAPTTACDLTATCEPRWEQLPADGDGVPGPSM